MNSKTNIFIKKAVKKHGNEYDYSKVEYVNAKTKVCIICPEHGEFWQTPTNHLSGRGCPKCIKLKKSETWKRKSSFIEKAKKVHGEKYDYSKVEYVNAKTKVCIICPEHGEFWQTPTHHLSGSGCPKCAKKWKMNTKIFIERANEKYEKAFIYDGDTIYTGYKSPIAVICQKHGEFITTPEKHLNGEGCPFCKKENKIFNKFNEFTERANKIHNGKYKYNFSNNFSFKNKVEIICPIHGVFRQTPSSHLRGQGCPKCANEAKKISLDSFVEKAKKIHGDKYDYSKVEYINTSTKVCIICPEHGEFWQTPNNHLSGKGCPICSGKGLSLEQLKAKFRCMHGDKYDYSKVNHIDAKTKVCIICPEHGEFWQTPNKHLMGHGCPKCNRSILEEAVAKFLDDKSITYSTQKQFDWLKANSLLSLDFYLPDYRIAIECQGKQHVNGGDSFFGSKTPINDFKELYERDKIKLEQCTSHGIKLIYMFDPKSKKEKILSYGIYNKSNICFDTDSLLSMISVGLD